MLGPFRVVELEPHHYAVLPHADEEVGMKSLNLAQMLGPERSLSVNVGLHLGALAYFQHLEAYQAAELGTSAGADVSEAVLV